jgi:hypothetical protein
MAKHCSHVERLGASRSPIMCGSSAAER